MLTSMPNSEYLTSERVEYATSERVEYATSERVEYATSERVEYATSERVEYATSAPSLSLYVQGGGLEDKLLVPAGPRGVRSRGDSGSW